MRRRLEKLIWRRAVQCCEYCRMAQEYDVLTFQVDHIVAVCHGGPTIDSNLYLACFLCNSYKGPNLTGVDRKTKKVALNPRKQRWTAHFRWTGAVLVGKTAVGRATIATLRINLIHRVAQRRELIEKGMFPIF
jgi:hypothetical protein